VYKYALNNIDTTRGINIYRDVILLISRFRVESTDISCGDARFKETTDNASDRAKPPTPQKSDSSTGKSTARKDSKKGGSPHNSQKRKNFSRSQSVTTPKPVTPKAEPNFSYSKQSSFSTMSDADLEDWKLSTLDSTASLSPRTAQQKEPILTVAGSLTDSSNVTVGFDVKEEETK